MSRNYIVFGTFGIQQSGAIGFEVQAVNEDDACDKAEILAKEYLLEHAHELVFLTEYMMDTTPEDSFNGVDE